MSFETLDSEFSHRYYRWRIEEAQKEFERSFHYLSQMRSFQVRRTLEIIGKLPEQERMFVLPTLIKASDRRLVARLKEDITAKEQALLDKLRILKECPELGDKLALQEANLVKVSKRGLKRDIKDALSRTLSPIFYSGLCFNIKLESKWVVQTHIEVGNSFYYYSHHICWVDEIRNINLRVGPPTINLPAWHGLYPSGWGFLSDEDAYQSANTIALLCKYFIESCSDLLHGMALE